MPSLSKKSLLAGLFAFLVLLTRAGVFIFTPLYLDSLSPWNWTNSKTTGPNGTTPNFVTNSTRPIYEQVDFFFAVSFSMGVDTIVLGIFVLITLAGCKGQITSKETQYPHKYFFIAGAAQGLSSLLFLYASSGARTAPYLQALLGNFHIPLTFTFRFLYLRKKPTLRKLICASLVAGSEMICLLPSIFPSLEDSTAHSEDGGALGPGRILWPLCFVGSMLPAAVSNVVLEKTVKDERSTKHGKEQLNMVYTLFWTYLSIFICVLFFFWTDLIPKFGLAPSITMFGKLFAYNARCVFGQEAQCGYPVPFLAWGRMLSKTMNVLFSAFLIRYGEGASMLVIVLALRTPVVFLFWALFEERPFGFAPHAHLSTYLSIGAICIMLPAMVVYNTGAPEKEVPKKTSTFNRHLQENGDDDAPLLEDSVEDIDTNSLEQNDRTA